MSYEIFYERDDSDYGEGIILEKYEGKFSLVAGNKSQKAEGTVYMKWGYPQGKDRKPIDKAIPWKVELGNSREAIKALQYFTQQLTNMSGSEPDFSGSGNTNTGDDDIPF